MKRVFSDFDGTWENISNLWGDVEAIVTGRSFQDYQDMMDEWEGPKKPIFMNPIEIKNNSINKIVLHKAEVINRCGVTTYYEDMPQEAAQLRILCPKTKIVLVKPGQTFI
jgi:hypothetical protein